MLINLYSFSLIILLIYHNIHGMQQNTQHLALHQAISLNNTQKVQELLADPNLNPNILDENGDTPLNRAYRIGNLEIIKILQANHKIQSYIEHKKNINYQKNKSPLHEAVKEGDLIRLQILLAGSKANPNISDTKGNTPLHIAVKLGNIAIIKALLTNPKTKIDIKNFATNTPLHMAAIAGNPLIIQMLLDDPRQIDSTIQNCNSTTPLHYAAYFNNSMAKDTLLQDNFR